MIPGNSDRAKNLSIAILTTAMAAVAVAILLLAAVPPVSRDALTHHLLVPKLWIQHGGLVELPHIRFSYYPMNLELLYLIPLYFGNDILPKYIHMAFGLMTAALIYRHLGRRLGRIYGLSGALVFLSLPVVVRLAITAYVDLGLTFFSFAALLGLLKWSENGFRPFWLVVSGVFCGLALGTKYNALVVFCLLVMTVLYLSGAGRERDGGGRGALRALAWTAIYIMVALTVFSPWMIRNYRLKGRPFYPIRVPVVSQLFDAHGYSDPGPSDGERKLPLDHFSYRRFAFGESFAQIAAIPLRIFFQGKDDDPKYFDGRLNPCLLIFPLAAFFFARKTRGRPKIERFVFGGFSLFNLLFAFFSIDMRIRYLAPIYAPLTILCIIGVRDLAQAARQCPARRLRCLLGPAPAVVLALLLATNGLYIARQFHKVRPLDFLSGKLTREAYIEDRRLEYGAFRYANEKLADGSRILALFLGSRLYYSDHDVVENIGLFNALARNSKSGDDLAKHLLQKGYTHLLLNYDFVNRWTADNAGPQAQQRIAAFFRQRTRSLFSGHGYGLIAIAGSP